LESLSPVNELVLLYSADSDIQAGYEDCERHQEGRGELFLRHLDLVLTRLRKFPLSAPPFHERYRRALVPGFPYGVFYAMEGGRIIVAGVMDLRQNPGAIRRRLGE
jgi:toxin ParE1/3/4